MNTDPIAERFALLLPPCSGGRPRQAAFPAVAPPVIPSNARDPSSSPILPSSGVGTCQGTASQLLQESPESFVGRGFSRDISLGQSIRLQPLKSFPILNTFFRTLSSRSAKSTPLPNFSLLPACLPCLPAAGSSGPPARGISAGASTAAPSCRVSLGSSADRSPRAATLRIFRATAESPSS